MLFRCLVTAMTLLGIIHVSCSKNPVCGQDEVCKQEIINAHTDMQFYHINSTQELDSICRLKLEFIRCVETYVAQCLPLTEQQSFRVLTSGSWEFMNMFCSTSSDIRREYIKKSWCFNKISTNLDQCAKEYENSQNDIDDVALDSQSLLKHTCCAYFENIRCSSNVTGEHCGKEAAELMTTLLVQRGGTYLNSKCEKYQNYKCYIKAYATHVEMDKNLLYTIVLGNISIIIIMQCFSVLIGISSE